MVDEVSGVSASYVRAVVVSPKAEAWLPVFSEDSGWDSKAFSDAVQKSYLANRNPAFGAILARNDGIPVSFWDHIFADGWKAHRPMLDNLLPSFRGDDRLRALDIYRREWPLKKQLHDAVEVWSVAIYSDDPDELEDCCVHANRGIREAAIANPATREEDRVMAVLLGV